MDEEAKWWLAFCSLVAWSQHPGYQREGSDPPKSLEELADVVDEMIVIANRRRREH